MRIRRWALGPGAVAAGRDITGPVIVINGESLDPLAGYLPNQRLMGELGRQLDLPRFTGRDNLITEIDQTVHSPGRGYVVVQGEAGVGKTALAAYLVWNRPCAYHFTRLPGGRSPEKARRSLAAQLIGAWRIQDEVFATGGQVPKQADDPAWLVEVLHAAAARRDQEWASGSARPPLVLIVDGLDEAGPADPERDTGIPLGLPRPEHLPDGVFVVVTTRFGLPLPGVRDPQTAWKTIQVDGPDNLADMRNYLTAAVATDDPDTVLRQAVLCHALDPERFVETLAQRCAGVWIYMRYVLDDIRAGGRSPTDVATLPMGLRGYYLDQIQRWQTPGEEWERVGLPLLATLVALQRPVSTSELADYAGPVEAPSVRRWLTEHFRPFLDATHPALGTPTYSVRHQSLRELFTVTSVDHSARRQSELSGDDGDEHDQLLLGRLAESLTRAHGRIFTRLTHRLDSSTESIGSSDYTRAHLARHAVGARRFDELVCDPRALLACEPAALLPHHAVPASPQARAAFNAYQLSNGSRVTQPDRAERWLHVWARKTRAEQLATRSMDPGSPSILRAWWTGHTNLTLSGHSGPVRQLCAVPLPGGGAMLASAGDDNVFACGIRSPVSRWGFR
ncbi:hypothetical protein GCM10023321_70370 [Pseudonocardia eucalypti]|uniref:Orc1-like AAA ATPase domain-containing protein n=1 Tax=Pseudonocardia eucalypti TaxID=648755 RepID=A0ABP9R5B5_9PSEU|nr:hypothetical protein [Pseudonocardia eucalypti]